MENAVRTCAGLLAALITLVGCKPASEIQKIRAQTFSISKTMRLAPTLTFSAMTVVNDTSAHLFRVNHHLSIEGDLVTRYEQKENGRIYRFYLHKNYRSGRRERIDSSDVIFTIKFYLRQHANLSSTYREIKGADQCTGTSCLLTGARAIDRHAFELRLESL